MTETTDYLTRLGNLAISVQSPDSGDDSGDEDEDRRDDHEHEQRKKRIEQTLHDACAIVREAEAANAPSFTEVLGAAEKVLNQTITESYRSDDLYDYLPSFAHLEGDLVDDKNSSLSLSPSQAQGLLSLLQRFADPGKVPTTQDMPGFQPPWSATPKRHPKSTPLSRYWKDTSPFSPTRSHPAANAIYSALCEVSSDEICNPIRLCISPNASVMHLSSAGGWKDRSPVSSFWNLNDDTAEGFQSSNIDVGLQGIIYHSVIEDDRKLIWVADEDRVKSFAWPNTSTSGQMALPMHTLDSPCDGPLHATNDRVFRAGKGFAATWKIDELETHGPDGNDAIGQIDVGSDGEDEDENDIEYSKGNQSTERVNFSNASLEPSYWAPHPSMAGHMLCVSDSARSQGYSCHALDLESGKIVDSYLGHGGAVNNISTSAVDPNVFLTSSDDGYVRLFDARHHLPMLTLNVGKSSDGCDAAVLCHPDGIPSIFTGSGKTEHITLWDVRAKTACYELATGNNAVHSMVWDSVRNTLYAATECRYIDRLGRNYDYRPARIPRDQRGHYGTDGDGNDDGDEDDDDDRAWPKDAFHEESYFGYTFDAARHTIFKYHFKADANTDIVPEDGQATVGDGEGW